VDHERAALPSSHRRIETWRKIRDSEGAEGWCCTRCFWTAPPWLRRGKGAATARRRRSFDARGRSARRHRQFAAATAWCRIAGKGFDGYMEQENLWGVYPGEKFE
jgi:SH3-like domain-containing protein